MTVWDSFGWVPVWDCLGLCGTGWVPDWYCLCQSGAVVGACLVLFKISLMLVCDYFELFVVVWDCLGGTVWNCLGQFWD